MQTPALSYNLRIDQRLTGIDNVPGPAGSFLRQRFAKQQSAKNQIGIFLVAGEEMKLFVTRQGNGKKMVKLVMVNLIFVLARLVVKIVHKKRPDRPGVPNWI